MRFSVCALAVCCGLAICSLLSLPVQADNDSADSSESKPNIVIIFADDLGYGDLSVQGHPSIRTPHLDRMAQQGMRFTDFYVASSVCTPSRAALLTGRLPIRSGMSGGKENRVIYPDSEGGLPEEEITLAEGLQDVGYATACIGKWHLGSRPQDLPTNHGFDYFFGLPFSNDMNHDRKKSGTGRKKAGINPNPDYHWWDVPLIKNTEEIERPVNQHTLTKRYTEEALRFIDEHQDGPFFLYLPHTMPHVPLFASEDFHDKSRRGRYGDTIEEIDWSVGQILQQLQDKGIAENTLVFFTSDNGPWLNREFAGGTAGLLRDGKAGTWEGGFRVPGIAWWPDRIEAGQVTSEIATTMDLYSTCLLLAGKEVPTDQEVDGVDLRPVLLENGESPRNIVHYYRGNELYAIRKGPFKAHFTTWYGYSKEPAKEHDPPLLFHLGKDPGEHYNIADEHPEVLEDLICEAEKHTEKMQPGKPQYYELSEVWEGQEISKQ